MITPEITNFIKQQIANGVSKDQIATSLKQNGWADIDIAEAFNSVPNQNNVVSPIPQPEKKSGLKYISIAAVILILLGGIASMFFVQQKNNLSSKSQISKDENQLLENNATEDLRINYVAVPVTENSVSIFESVGTNTFSKEDGEFLSKYFNNYSSVNLPPLTESRKILTKYQDILKTFEMGITKKYYQCSLVMGDKCSLNSLRDISRLGALNSFVLAKDGKKSEAQEYALNVVKSGQMVTAQADEMINLLVGWSIQKLGYNMAILVRNASFSGPEKTSLINNLRNEHKKVFRFLYTRQIETIDYITDQTQKPLGVIDQETEDLFNEYRKVANNTTWKPDIVKKWFYDSLKIALSNVDLPCGNELRKSQIDIGFNPEDKSQTENYVGKTLYTTTYTSLDSSNTERCEIEDLINSL